MKRRWVVRFSLGSFLLAAVCSQTSLAQSPAAKLRAVEMTGVTAAMRAAAGAMLVQPQADAGSLVKAAALLDLSGAPNRVDAYRRVVDSGGSSAEAQAARRRLV